jgi:molybdopterin synthase catalytic subunit
MELQIRLFATLKDRVGGQRAVFVTVAEPATVRTVHDALTAAYPALADHLPHALTAVNKVYAGLDTAVTPGDELAIFPPVSGGSDLHPTHFALSEEAPDVTAVIAYLTRPDVGAVVTFTGSVRGETAREGLPSETIHLEYEAYEEMAVEKMAQIAREIWERWPTVKGVAIVQRIGKLEIGQLTTLVACAAAHRDQGVFDAARYGIDRLKEIVPVWKKEVGADRAVWIEGHYRPEAER